MDNVMLGSDGWVANEVEGISVFGPSSLVDSSSLALGLLWPQQSILEARICHWKRPQHNQRLRQVPFERSSYLRVAGK